MNCFTLVVLYGFIFGSSSYQPTWDSLDQRPLPQWYDESKFGVFMHFGVFSVPAVISEWFVWYWRNATDPEAVRFMQDNFKPNFSYSDFAPMLTAEFFNATAYAELVRKAGARWGLGKTKYLQFSYY